MYPALSVPPDTTYDESNLRVEPSTEEGHVLLIFGDIEAESAQYSAAFGNRLQILLTSLAFPPTENSSKDVPG